MTKKFELWKSQGYFYSVICPNCKTNIMVFIEDLRIFNKDIKNPKCKFCGKKIENYKQYIKDEYNGFLQEKRIIIDNGKIVRKQEKNPYKEQDFEIKTADKLTK